MRIVRFAIMVIAAARLSMAAPPQPSIRVVKDVALNLGLPRDVRWTKDGHVLIAAGLTGVHEFDPATGTITTIIEGTKIRKPGGTANSFFLSARLAADKYLITSSVFAGFAWRQMSAKALEPMFAFEFIADIDTHGDKVALIGATRGDDGSWNPQRGVVWTGTISKGLKDLAPLITSDLTGTQEPINRCHYLELGSLRYMKDGSLIVMPGVSPGVFLYSPAGKLVRTWETEGLGFEDRCRLTDEQFESYRWQPQPRYTWINQKRVVNELVLLPTGPALIVRQFAKGRVTWSLMHLLADGGVRTEALPLQSAGPYAHLRADVAGKRIALLLTEYNLPGEPPPPPSRLILAEVN
jgi:hypothetical protein